MYMDDFATCKCLPQFSKTDKESTIEEGSMNLWFDIFLYSFENKV